jgi:hypothetical protein
MDSNRPKCLLEDYSPIGNVVAVVEQDTHTCYFYLYGDKAIEFGVKSCWVRNLAAAPAILDAAGMRAGVPPMLPRNFCKHPDDSAPLQSAALSVVWSEEGDAAALRENDEIIAIIPSWSGEDGFHGYARDCVGQSSLCWELGTPESNVQFSRYQKALEYWNSWSAGNGPWPDFKSRMMEAIECRVGKHSNYYAIDGGKWPPKAMLRIPDGDSVLLVTLGMSLRPQPRVELNYEDPAPYRRVELGISLNSSLPPEAINQIAKYMSGQTAYPWHFHTYLGSGHTLPADTFAEISGGMLPFALLQSRPEFEPIIQLPQFRGDPVTLLWMHPISEREKTFAEENGSAQLAGKLHEQGLDRRHSLRRPEVL